MQRLGFSDGQTDVEMDLGKNEDLFLSVLQKHKGILYKVANAYCRDEEDKKDLIQEITIQLWRSFEKYDSQYKYSTWIYTIALNVSISFYRKDHRRKQISSPLSNDLLHLAEIPFNNETDTQIELLQKFISELKELDKALMLLYLEEKGYKEISRILGISETNVATKMARIKALLRQKFSTI